MELHRLTYAKLAVPPLSADDPAATVWLTKENAPDVIAKRVDGWCWFRLEELATYRFPPTSPDRSVSCVVDVDEGSDLESVEDGYFRTVVPLALQVYGLEALHGTAVETPAGAVAICGRTHAGKTTLTYALSRRGLRVLADDGVVIDPAGPEGRVAVQPIPFELMIRPPVAEHFGTPEYGRITTESGDAPIVTVPAVPLAAVILLDRVEQGDLEVVPLSKTEGYTALLGHCYVFSLDDVGRKAKMMSAYARFANSVPVYRLTYPTGLENLDAAAAAIAGLFETAPGQALSTNP